MENNLRAAERVNSGSAAIPMTAKEFLQQYRAANDKINARLDQISKLRCLATKTTSTLMPDRVQSSGPASKLEDAVAQIADMVTELDSDIDRLQTSMRKVEAVITAVSDARQQAVLTRRYINGLTWEGIALELNYTYRNITYIHGQALRVVEKIIS